MTAQHTPARRSRRLRNGAATAAATAALIATSGYTATTTVAANAYPPATTSDEIAPTKQVMRDLDRTIRALYGPRPISTIAARHHQQDQVIRGLYGPGH
jgi:hypothetical protein